jgi:hypothetical protein
MGGPGRSRAGTHTIGGLGGGGGAATGEPEGAVVAVEVTADEVDIAMLDAAGNRCCCCDSTSAEKQSSVSERDTEGTYTLAAKRIRKCIAIVAPTLI